jgi:chaperonin cofactor prefoldin
VESFWRNYPALYKHFYTLLQSKDKHKATYAGLVKRMETIEFVEDVAIMKDCLGQFLILSESLQKDCTTLLKASDYLQWTINALEKIKDSLETKYEFRNIYDSSEEFKGVELRSFQSRTGYKWFNRKQFLQGLIDNLQRRMIDSSEKILLKYY